MELNPETKIEELLTAYPFMIDVLVELSPKFENLKDPLIRKTMGQVATLKMASEMGGISLDDMMSRINAAIKSEGGGSVANGESAQPEMGKKEKQEALKGIIRDLHKGEEMEVLKQRFKDVIQGVNALEISAIEQQLMDEGLPAEEIKRLCDVHVEIFKDALEAHDKPESPAGHPVHTYMEENRVSEDIISEISLLIGRLGQPPKAEAMAEHRDELGGMIERLSEIETHYARKENQLFPFLEEHHFTGPSQVMWAIHDDIRALLKQARQGFEESDPEKTVTALKEVGAIIRDMIYKEELILFPASLEMLSEQEWIKIKEGEPEIGYSWVEPAPGWPETGIGESVPETAEPQAALPVDLVSGVLGLDTGGLTHQQINLLLNHLPVDITFVDENDRVAFYSEGKERLFPRSPAVIGREVRNCHPPNSVHVVNKILDEFKSGSKDTAEFWIEMGPRFIYIRYFAVRDSEKIYKGCLEVSQDLTEIRKLEGQKHLLDWE